MTHGAVRHEKITAKGIGLAIIGGGRVGLFRGEVAARHPAVEWIGLAEKNPNRAGEVAPKIDADFVTQSHVELLKRPEVTAAIIATDEHLHVDPIMAAVERGMPMLIEKPLATDLEEIRAGAQGDQGRQARRRGRLHPALPPPLAGGQGEMPHRRARRRHAGDLARLHEPAGGDRQLQAHRRSVDHLADGDLRHARARHLHVVPRRQDAGRVLRALDRQGAGPALPGHRRHRRHDHVRRRHGLSPQHFLGAAGDLAGARSIRSRSASSAPPACSPSTTPTATSCWRCRRRNREGYNPDATRLVDFMGSYPPGDMALGELRGPMAEETV